MASTYRLNIISFLYRLREVKSTRRSTQLYVKGEYWESFALKKSSNLECTGGKVYCSPDSLSEAPYPKMGFVFSIGTHKHCKFASIFFSK